MRYTYILRIVWSVWFCIRWSVRIRLSTWMMRSLFTIIAVTKRHIHKPTKKKRKKTVQILRRRQGKLLVEWEWMIVVDCRKWQVKLIVVYIFIPYLSFLFSLSRAHHLRLYILLLFAVIVWINMVYVFGYRIYAYVCVFVHL